MTPEQCTKIAQDAAALVNKPGDFVAYLKSVVSSLPPDPRDTRRGPKPDPEVMRLAAEAMKLFRKSKKPRKCLAWEVTKDEAMQARVLNYLNANWAKLQDFGEK